MRKHGFIWITLGLFCLLFSVASSYLKGDATEQIHLSLSDLLSETLEQKDRLLDKSGEIADCIKGQEKQIPQSICGLDPNSPYGFTALTKEKELVYWNTDRYPIYSLYKSASLDTSWQVINTGDHFYIIRKSPINDYGLFQGIELRNFFLEESKDPSLRDIHLSRKATQTYIDHSALDQKVFIEDFELDIPIWRKLLSTMLYVTGFFTLLIGIYLVLKDQIKRASLRIALFMVVVVFVEWLTGHLPISLTFEQSLLQQAIFDEGMWQPSLMDLFIDIVLLGSFVLLITNEIKLSTPKKMEKWKRYLYGLAHYLTLLGFLLFSAFAIRQMIVQANAILRIEHLLQWDIYSVLLLGAIVIFISIIFLLSYYLHKQVKLLSFSIDQKLVLLLGASAVLLPIYLLLNTGIHPFAFFIVAYIFVILLDLFTENVAGGLTWPFIWLSVFAGFTSLLIFTFSQDRLELEEQQFLTSDLDFSSAREVYSASGDEFTIAQYKNGKRTDFSGNYFPKSYPFDSIPVEGQIMQVRKDQVLYQVFQNDKQETRITAHELTPITKPISLYSYLFVLWVIFTLLLLVLNSWFNFLPDEWSFHWAYFPSLRKRIQYYILAVTVGSFLIISLVTYFYYINTAENQFKTSILASTSKLRDDIETNMNQETSSLSTIFENRKEMHRLDAFLYASDGTAISKAATPMIPYGAYVQLNNQSNNAFIHGEGAYAPVISQGAQIGILSVPLEAQNTSLLSDFDDLITTLLNVYVFLFVLASGLAVAISNSITAPLKVLSEKLKGLKLGKKNEPLEWENKDELGELIQDYNRMIQQLEESAEVLAATERETAWREMAKQVAHEIKNPLTPMKLSIQHLQIAMDRDGERDEKLFKNVTQTLIEQIDNLNKIASEFSNFAKMPEPENEKVILNDVVASIHDLFRKREDMDINLFVPIDEIHVFADKNHLMRVMNNLLKNAIQSIPTDRRGKINIELYKENEDAIISVEDNGKGIPESVRDKVFKPNFTSKSSGTGLGLAICANIIEGFNGKIYFETEEGKGTTFYVIIPLMRMEDNFKERERVIL